MDGYLSQYFPKGSLSTTHYKMLHLPSPEGKRDWSDKGPLPIVTSQP